MLPVAPVKQKGWTMTDDELCQTDACGIRELYSARKVSPVEVTDAFLRRIAKINPVLNSFVCVSSDNARAAAKRAEQQQMDGSPTPLLHGLPFSVKDNIMTEGIPSTSGSPLFKDHVPTEDWGVVASLKRAGAFVIGKTNTPAFGWTGTTDNKLFGPTPNPYDARLTAGGSSGGAAVAAATHLAPINIGTDGGGSLRTPAAFTGTVGFKPSHGRIADVPPHTHWSLQHYGPIARSVRDIALILEAAAGPHPRDPHSLPAETINYRSLLDRAPEKKRVLFTTQLGFTAAVDPVIAALCRNAANACRELGWDVVEHDLAWPDPAPFANILSAAGLWSRLRNHGHKVDDIEPGILSILEFARSLPPHAFYEAYAERNLWCAHAHQLFETIDILMTPTTAAPPFELGRLFPDTIDGKPARPSDWSPYLRSFNITGQPAISVPVGTTKTGLPVGMQMVGGRFGDAQLLAVAAAFERLRPWPVKWDMGGMKNRSGSRALKADSI
jgi:aspartyl-tRNA(Asn)/glutamyl-tRNA(Gln) amidotransferase subunit A